MANEADQSLEAAVSAMVADAPPDWVSLHAEFGGADALATVDTESADAVSLKVPSEALRDIASHQRRAAERGESWQRLIIDCDRSGDISIRTVRAGLSTVARRRLMWALCALAAIVVLAVGAALLLLR
jgi:hypothetical protein